jgi:hypothetical protein
MTVLLALNGCAFVSMDLGNLTRMQPFEERVIHEGTRTRSSWWRSWGS